MRAGTQKGVNAEFARPARALRGGPAIDFGADKWLAGQPHHGHKQRSGVETGLGNSLLAIHTSRVAAGICAGGSLALSIRPRSSAYAQPRAILRFAEFASSRSTGYARPRFDCTALMASRRLPGSRDPNRPSGSGPLGGPPPPPAPTLFDGESSGLTAPPARRGGAKPPPPRIILGPRLLLSIGVLLHIAIAPLLVPRMIRALDRLWLSSGQLALNPMQLVPAVAIGAAAFGTFLWAWSFRSRPWAITFLLLSAAWWACLSVVIF